MEEQRKFDSSKTTKEKSAWGEEEVKKKNTKKTNKKNNYSKCKGQNKVQISPAILIINKYKKLARKLNYLKILKDTCGL